MKILVTEPIDAQGIAHLEQTGQVIYGTGTSEDIIIQEGQDADAILVRVAKITENIIKALPRLKVVAKHGIGVDNIDVDCCTRHGVLVVNAPKSNAIAVAEHTVALILAAAKNLVHLDCSTREGDFFNRNSCPTTELAGKTAGFIGMGNIASLVARRLKAFDMHLVAYDPYVTECAGVEMVKTPEEVYKKSDIVSVHVPLTLETRHMISDRALQSMKDGTILINAARGGIVDEAALYRALSAGKLRSAAFDVFESEPPAKDNPLFALNNVTVSPHNAALSEQALVNMAVHAARGICDYLEGRTPEWVVNGELIKREGNL